METNLENMSLAAVPQAVLKVVIRKKSFWERLSRDMRRNRLLYVIFLPVFLYLVIFNYIPMAGILIAFENFKVTRGVFGSQWVGMQNFADLFTGEGFPLVIRNTASMAFLNLTIGYIAPVILALLITQLKSKTFRRSVQVISYTPYFVAAVVVCQIVVEFLGTNGALTGLLSRLGFEKQNWLANSNVPVFWFINMFTNLWQSCGYGAIVFIAAIMNVNPDIHEAAVIDGANRWQRMWRVTFPSILPFILTMFTLRIGLVFTLGFDKVLLMYKPIIYDTADCIFTYTYRMAFGSQINYSLAAASGLFQSVVATCLLLFSRWLAKKLTKTSLF